MMSDFLLKQLPYDLSGGQAYIEEHSDFW